jgi:hypothetical protein
VIELQAVMMFADGALTFREFAVREPVPLATIQQAILEFLRGRKDAVVFGAQAVNAYVDEPRMTQDIDLLALRAADLANELRGHLAGRFHIAVRVRAVGRNAHRLFQVRKPKNRHLADVRHVTELPRSRTIAGVLVLEPAELVAAKVIAYQKRRGQPKSGTDWRDLASLLLKFPELKSDTGAVFDALNAREPDDAALGVWRALVLENIVSEDDEEGF